MSEFKSGFIYDDLIGMTARTIQGIRLPNEKLGIAIKKASQILTDKNFCEFRLVELWGDGHSVWQRGERGEVILVDPTGNLSYKAD